MNRRVPLDATMELYWELSHAGRRAASDSYGIFSLYFVLTSLLYVHLFDAHCFHLFFFVKALWSDLLQVFVFNVGLSVKLVLLFWRLHENTEL